MWILYSLSKESISQHKTCLLFIMLIFTSSWPCCVASIITKHIFVEPLPVQFQEGLPLKNRTELKLGGSDTYDFHIFVIQYEVEVTNSSGLSNSVRVQACIYTKDLDSLCILPMQPMSIYDPEPPKHYTGTNCTLLVSPLGCISFYNLDCK